MTYVVLLWRELLAEDGELGGLFLGGVVQEGGDGVGEDGVVVVAVGECVLGFEDLLLNLGVFVCYGQYMLGYWIRYGLGVRRTLVVLRDAIHVDCIIVVIYGDLPI